MKDPAAEAYSNKDKENNNIINNTENNEEENISIKLYE